MFVGTKVIKNTAKTALKGNWLKAVITGLLPVFCSWIIIYISSVTEIFAGTVFAQTLYVLMSILLFFPLCLGTLRFFWRMISGCDDNPISAFYYFCEKKLYIKTLRLLLSSVLKLIPIGIVLFLPALFLWAISQNFIFKLMDIPIPLWTRNLNYALMFSKTLATVVLILFAVRYYISPILFVADSDMDVAEALYMSTVIAKSTSFDFIYLIFSFSGWILLSFLAIPLVFTLPYFVTSYVVHTKSAISEYNMHIERINAEQYPSFSVGV